MFKACIFGNELAFDAQAECFSPGSVDRGTLAMLSCVTIRPGDRVLDLGCGYGVVGIAAAKITGAQNVVMTDVSQTAVACAKANAIRNGVEGIETVQGDAFEAVTAAGFDLILCNPPYHTDFAVAKTFIEKGFNRLRIGGRMWMVTKRRDWYKNKLISIFGGVRLTEVDGYFVFEAEKRQATYASTPRGKGKRA